MTQSGNGPNMIPKNPPLSFPKPHKGGLILFGAFVWLYGTFVVLNAIFPDSMGGELITGINFAVAGGVGIIFATFLIAAMYSWIRRAKLQTKMKEPQS